MLSKEIVISEKIEKGREIPLLVQTASRFQSRIIFTQEEKTANVKSIMGMLNFGLAPGQKIGVQIEGEDEEQAMKSLEEFLTAN